MNIQVRATKTMAAYLAKQIPEYSFQQIQYSPREFGLYVDLDISRHFDDYSGKTGKFRAIKVSYPERYYAMPAYLTTRTLDCLFRSTNRTARGFIDAVKRELEI